MNINVITRFWPPFSYLLPKNPKNSQKKQKIYWVDVDFLKDIKIQKNKKNKKQKKIWIRGPKMKIKKNEEPKWFF